MVSWRDCVCVVWIIKKERKKRAVKKKKKRARKREKKTGEKKNYSICQLLFSTNSWTSWVTCWSFLGFLKFLNKVLGLSWSSWRLSWSSWNTLCRILGSWVHGGSFSWKIGKTGLCLERTGVCTFFLLYWSVFVEVLNQLHHQKLIGVEFLNLTLVSWSWSCWKFCVACWILLQDFVPACLID